jgi:hypothetical protein
MSKESKRNEQIELEAKRLCERIDDIATYRHRIIENERQRIQAALMQYPQICQKIQSAKDEIKKLHTLIEGIIALQVKKKMAEVELAMGKKWFPKNVNLKSFEIGVNLQAYQAVTESVEIQQFRLAPPSGEAVNLVQKLLPGSPASEFLGLEYKTASALFPSIVSLPDPEISSFMDALLGENLPRISQSSSRYTLFQFQGAPAVLQSVQSLNLT